MKPFYGSPQIIVPIRPRSVAEARRLLAQAEQVANLVEIWLDRLQPLNTPTVRAVVKLATKPVLINLKDSREHGEFGGNLALRLALLGAAAEAGATWVDLPLHLPASTIAQFRQQHLQTQLIISWHDFAKMPSLARLRTLAARAKARGATIVKLVGTAQTVADCLPILQLTRELAAQQTPCLLLAMGTAGQLTRVLTPLLGAFGTFATLAKTSATAPGQLTAAEVRQWWECWN